MTTKDLYWLAGLLEGEGSFDYQCRESEQRHGRPRIQFASTDHDIAVRVAALFKKRVNGPYRAYGGQLNKKPMYKVLLSGPRAVGLMFTLWSILGTRRREQIKVSVARWRAARAA